ncbi:SMP-30/gluconolactonase/LRE family protein [uncultured Helicobacter sp.]|uniref:SMP-30/gluconolactonase/LRE family protein n=1 Tax=uncultured Helicobacter sp. TaxID=175537 RepID=UPI003752B4DF
MPALHTTLARFCACVVFVLQTTQLCAQESTPRTKDIQIKAYDTSFYALIDKDTKAFVLYNKGIWPEGAVMLPDKSLIFSDVKANKLLRYDEKQGVSVYLPISHFQNGHTLDTKGNLIAASHGKRGIEKFENGKWVMLADSYKGKNLIAPMTALHIAMVIFILPIQPLGSAMHKKAMVAKSSKMANMSIATHLQAIPLCVLIRHSLKPPNGLALSPDEKTLYVADSQKAYNTDDPTLHAHIIAYTLDKDNNLSQERIFATFKEGFPDGIKVDSKGNVWSSGKNGILVFSPDGTLLGEIIVGNVVGNLAFGVNEANKPVLYITANTELLRIDLPE